MFLITLINYMEESAHWIYFDLWFHKGFCPSGRRMHGGCRKEMDHVSSGMRCWVIQSNQRTKNGTKHRAELLPSKASPKWFPQWVQPVAQPDFQTHEPTGHISAWNHNSDSTKGKLLMGWTCFTYLYTPTIPLHTYPSTILYWPVNTFFPWTVTFHCFL